MATKNKTWKIGEYAKGGIITAQVTESKVTIICKDWDFSTGSRRSSDQSGAKEIFREEVGVKDEGAYRTLSTTLNDWTTSYYAEQVLDWIKANSSIRTSF